jgi:hypothetical protein
VITDKKAKEIEKACSMRGVICDSEIILLILELLVSGDDGIVE